ncbi:MAG: hypothetical protein IKG91_05270 [Firmicutes bacterium]|nr:hypothetical protein [Bacillota bacterium]
MASLLRTHSGAYYNKANPSANKLASDSLFVILFVKNRLAWLANPAEQGLNVKKQEGEGKRNTHMTFGLPRDPRGNNFPENDVILTQVAVSVY